MRDHAIRVGGALALLVVGFFVARLSSALARRFVRRGVEVALRRGSVEPSRFERLAPEVIGGVVFWVVFVFFAAAATEQLGSEVVTGAVSTLAGYLPSVLGAALIVFAALMVGEFAARGVERAAHAAGIAYAGVLGRAVKTVTLLIAGVIALEELGVDSTLLVLLTGIVLGSLIGGAALAFGLGARTLVSNILASHYLLTTYRAGQMIKVDGVQGRIVEIKPIGVVLDSTEGQVLIPAKSFSETKSVLVNE
jgi:small-conductance mechanosensitive channel